MSRTTLTEVNDQIQTFWDPMFTKQLREDTILASKINRDYVGSIKRGGDTVQISQINAPTGQVLTVGVDADSFTPEALVTQSTSIVADTRIVGSYQFDDLVDIQSQIKDEKSEIRRGLMFSLEKNLNDYLYGKVAPSASAPAHDLSGVSNMNAAQLRALRLLAAESLWRRDKPWHLLASPSYYGDMLADATLASSDFGAQGAVTNDGSVTRKYGFNIQEDNSRATDYALAFSPDFLHLVMQKGVEFKISDLHSQNRFGYVISANFLVGSALGIDGDSKHIRITA